MVRCWKCGRENEEGMRFCTNCGTPITPSQAGGAAGYDPSQSETISFNAPPPQTALGTGTPTTPYTAGPPFAETSPPKSRTGMIIGIVAGALLLGIVGLAGIAGYFYYSKAGDTKIVNVNRQQNTSDPDAKPTPSASPEASPSPKQSFEPPTEATKQGSFTVYANEGWQLSDIAVIPLEKYTSRVAYSLDYVECNLFSLKTLASLILVEFHQLAPHVLEHVEFQTVIFNHPGFIASHATIV